jgi:exosortase family protein XrtM
MPPVRTGSPLRAFLPRALVFLTVFALLQLGWQGVRGTAIQDFVVHEATVRPAAFLVRTLTPAVRAQAVDDSLQAPGGGIRVVNGCEGTEVLFLLIAGFVVAPIAWRSRVTGFLAGIVVVFALNQARILALFYAFRRDPALFDLLHTTVTPIAVVLLLCAYFYAWLAMATPRLPAAA